MITIKKTLADDKAPRKSNATGNDVINEKKPFYQNKWVLISGGVIAAGLVYFLFIRGKGNKLEAENVTPNTN